MSIEHKDITTGNVHFAYNWSFTNATTRAAAGTFVSGDIGKWAYQQSDSTIWQLASFDGGGVPTWTQVAPGGSDPNQAANTVKAGPASGADAAPTYRALVTADLPTGVLLMLPQGTFLRSYTFDTTVESWTAESGATLSDVSGQLQLVGGANTSAVEPSSPTGGTVADGEIHCDWNNVSGANANGIVFRYQDVNNFLMLTWAGTAQTFYKKVGGSFTAIAVFTAPMTQGVIYRMLIRFVGSRIWLYMNGSFFATLSDSSILTAGRVGIFSNGGTVKLDAMKVYSLSSSWTYPAL